MFFPGASQTGRVANHEQASRSQFSWRSKDSEAWNSNPRSYSGRIAKDGCMVVTSGWFVLRHIPRKRWPSGPRRTVKEVKALGTVGRTSLWVGITTALTMV